MIVWKTIKIADDIKRIMNKKVFPNYNEIKVVWEYFDTSNDSLTKIVRQKYSKIVCETVKDKRDFPYYDEIKSKQIPQQDAYVPLFAVEETYTAKLVVEPAEYTPSKIKKCNHYELLSDLNHTDEIIINSNVMNRKA